jgi:hypothetical protein
VDRLVQQQAAAGRDIRAPAIAFELRLTLEPGVAGSSQQQAPEGAAGDELVQRARRGVRALLVYHAELYLMGPADGEGAVGIGQRRGHRLLHQNVLAGHGCRLDQRSVRAGGRADGDQLDVLPLQQGRG